MGSAQESVSWLLVAIVGVSVATTLRPRNSVWNKLEAIRRKLQSSQPQPALDRIRNFLDQPVAFLNDDSALDFVQFIVDAFGASGVAVYAHHADGRILTQAVAGLAPKITGESAAPGPDAPIVLALRNGLLAIAPRPSGVAFSDEEQLLLSLLALHMDDGLLQAEQAREIARLQGEVAGLRERLGAAPADGEAPIEPVVAMPGIIGASATLEEILRTIARAAPTEIPFLITGETGTGKELIARAVHQLSPRSGGPLICVNCPAIPVELAESELFGHERGAFTGATETRVGKFEAADGGTLFLDEVADLPMSVQTKLLRVLQEREVQRLGSHRVQKLDIRIVAATNRNLRREVAQGRFREDLLYRLAGVEIDVPPLRRRGEDIPMLAAHFLERVTTTYGRGAVRLSRDALTALCRYEWPGNVRELQHVIERAVLLCSGRVIRASHLGALRTVENVVHESTLDLGTPYAPSRLRLRDRLTNAKVRHVTSALTRACGNQAAAARLLGMSRSNLSRLLKRYGIPARQPEVSAATESADVPSRRHESGTRTVRPT